MKTSNFLSIFISLFIFTALINADDEKWDVNNPPGDFEEVEFTLDEGTWINLDVSPDGKQIVFDLLGDIYIMPITGGEAKLIRGGLAWEIQPRFSPDGKVISFTSDANGGDNIWIMNIDGSDAKQVTDESFRLLNNSEWMPDGEYIVARKHFTGTRSLGAGELWIYHKTGGSGIRLTERKNDQQDLNEPTVSPDGKYIYYSEDMYPGGYFQYNKDPNDQIYVVKRYDTETGENKTIISGPGGACRPQVSPNGKLIAYVKRVRTSSVLFLYDTETGEEWPLYDKLSKDQQEAWAIFGVYTGFDWTPDSKNVIIWADGKIKKVNIENGNDEIIPFEVNSKHKIYNALNFRQEVSPDKFEAKAIRNAVTSPDGKTLIFNAAGYLWKKTLPNGKPERLTNATEFEFEPAFSNDGNKVVYVTWDDEETGSIKILDLANNTSKSITQKKGIYRTPSFSNDSKKVVFTRESGNIDQGFSYTTDPGIYYLELDDVGKHDHDHFHFVTDEGAYPVFNNDDSRIYYQTGGYFFGPLDKSYCSVDLSGNDKTVHFESKYANKFVPSPDGELLAFNELHKAYVVPFPKTGQKISLSANMKEIPITQFTRDAGINLHWSSDSKKINWTLGGEYFSKDVSELFTFLPNSPEELPPMDSTGIKIGLMLETDKPEGKIALKNGKIITMDGENIIENGTVIIEGNKIIEVGESSSTNIPDDAYVVDCTGKTIMPGLVDVHAHLGAFRYGLSPQKHWPYYASLAYGITTTHDPSANTEMVFSHSEAVKAGNMVGPRVYSTGIILYGADGDFKAVVNNYEDALSALRRTKAFGAFSVKSYNQPRRDQRQMIIEAARELNMHVYPEGGSTFYHNLTMILDGHTGVEHNLPIAPLYNDVVSLFSSSKTANTPTLIVAYGAVNGEYYWYQNINVWENEKLLNFTPRAVIDSRSRHRKMIPDDEYENGHILISESLKKLNDAGTKINMGSHGQIQGIGAHWEIWMLEQGGMTEMECLQASTINGAEYIGMGDQIGSIKEGKIADIIILEKDPLENIRNTEFVEYTIINGRIYNTKTMNEIGNYNKPRTDFYWENSKASQAFPWHMETGSFSQPQCSCGN